MVLFPPDHCAPDAARRRLGYRPVRMDAFKPGYRRIVLAMLLAAYTLNAFDRSIVNLLLEPIGREFGASDLQLGLLSGPAFAAFYSTLAIPIAMLADRWSRRNTLVLSVLLWSVMTSSTASRAASWPWCSPASAWRSARRARAPRRIH